MSTTEKTWTVGQRAVIDRRTVVTVDRVTPAGRAVVGVLIHPDDVKELT